MITPATSADFEVIFGRKNLVKLNNKINVFVTFGKFIEAYLLVKTNGPETFIKYEVQIVEHTNGNNTNKTVMPVASRASGNRQHELVS